ncbi:unnamed protein product [Microthlaspi erraticum]|uniref:Uncharacterized protein n=1 Tax=Microthlaspi erraticum TaxID=1685480 RepID=A0A6D2I2K5_9BRAS|nr:unnamed protein product [Microthlaspi erraticum]
MKKKEQELSGASFFLDDLLGLLFSSLSLTRELFGFSSCKKRKVSHAPSLLLHVVYGPTLYQGKLQTLARPLLYSIKAFGAAARAIRHSKSSMGFVYSLTGHVSDCMGLSSTVQLRMKKGATFMPSSTNPCDPPVELGQTFPTLH